MKRSFTDFLNTWRRAIINISIVFLLLYVVTLFQRQIEYIANESRYRWFVNNSEVALLVGWAFCIILFWREYSSKK